MESAVSVRVTVTFLRMDRKPGAPAHPLPTGASVIRVSACSVPFYRYMYDEVGGDYVWWLRRTMPDAELAALLGDPRVSIHVLYAGGEPAGFYELDRRHKPDVNISYFGLMPHAVGKGMGSAFLRSAIDVAWDQGARGITVNTCTADHPRALPTYIRAGFKPIREARELWTVPTRLGLRISASLRA
jgi:GNAT superfamily N-acetyltransferase